MPTRFSSLHYKHCASERGSRGENSPAEFNEIFVKPRFYECLPAPGDALIKKEAPPSRPSISHRRKFYIIVLQFNENYVFLIRCEKLPAELKMADPTWTGPGFPLAQGLYIASIVMRKRVAPFSPIVGFQLEWEMWCHHDPAFLSQS
ncbi:hypothetical protein AVEN_253733-1 [Araneus ventricosus]|uniref:Uncharacterized protein n=1 Tax=Araneus ventricosus TaxID=182803 RepID=A0A4Y2DX54_ARAVE|nr:hypothetical protein AVEN_253733-1 [Araneus ventricosus]